ncbi:MAG TPA: hypothetical protein QKA08_05630 [Candidatus Megaira endosymbiont of Nemacystus decipiens]|nr:hypothetical protein [Candidatus Megaera endosymbiont of Nemacystus decipiens]
MYRLYPDISYPSFLKSQVLEALPYIVREKAQNNKHYLDGLLSVSGHALNPLVDCFNPQTGKPKIAHKVGDWPHIKHAKGNSASLVYITNLVIGKNTVGEVSDVLVSFFEGNTDVNQLFQIYKYLDTDTHEIGFEQKKELDIKDQCVLHFDAHYRVKENKPWKSVKKAAATKSTNLWILKQINRVSPDTIKKRFEDKKLAERLLELKEKYDVKGNQLIIKEEYRNDTSIDDIVNKMQMLLELEEVRKFDWAASKHIPAIAKSTPTIKSTFFPKKREDIQYQKRQQLDDEIDDLLKDKPYLVISGPPGQGKSTFASYYIKSKSKNEGCLVRYISASSENDIIASFKQIAAGYEIKGIEDEYLTQIILAKLSDQGKYNNTDVILCLDNVESYDDISECLDNLDENVKAIITTRNPMIVVNKEYVFKLPPFNKKESLKYLKKNLPSKFRGVDQLEKLIAEVGDKYGNTTPYHMNKTAAWFKVNSVETTIDDYIKDIRTYKANGEEEPETKMLLDFLNKSENHAESWKLLQYASYLDPDFIDPLILSELLDLSDVKGLNSLVPSLQKLSLIDKVENDLGKEGFTLHRLVQKTTKSYITKHKDNPKVPTLTNEEIQEKLIKTLNDLMPMVDRSTKKWDEANKSYKHVEKLLKEIDFDKLPSEDKAVLKELTSLLTKAGHYNLYATSTYKQSLEYYKQALQLNKAIYDENDPSVATSYNNVGGVLTYTWESIKKH